MIEWKRNDVYIMFFRSIAGDNGGDGGGEVEEIFVKMRLLLTMKMVFGTTAPF